MHIALVVPNLSAFRALSGKAFMVTDKEVPYRVHIHVLLQDDTSAVAGIDWQVRLAMVRLGLVTAEQMHVRAIDIEPGYEREET